MSEEQRRKLQQQLWAICNYLRGKMNGDEFRDYILGFIFYKYLSESLYLIANNALEGEGIDYADLNESHPNYADFMDAIRQETIDTVGYHLNPDQLFSALITRIQADKDSFILDHLNTVLTSIENSTQGAQSEDDFVHLFEDLELNSTKIGKTPDARNAVVKEILTQLNDISFQLTDVESDVLGDSYEYLISNFASDAGKKAGEFYTPQQVSEILAKIVSLGKDTLKSVYDPTCGSGSLLLRVAKEVDTVGRYYGQEQNRTTFNLARMNMILHGVHYRDFEIKQDDTLENPQHGDKKFEAIVANPPFSMDWSADSLKLNDERFAPYGKLAPKSKADFAFIQHMLYHLADNGTAAVVVPHGVLFRGAAEGHIRQHIIKNMNALDAVIGLPENIFFGTGIPSAILVFKKCREDSDNVLFIDASNDYEKGKKQNKLRDSDITKIMKTLEARSTLDKYSHLVPLSEIAENDYNLNIPRYVDTFEEEETIDLAEILKQEKEVNARLAEIEVQMQGFLKELGYVV